MANEDDWEDVPSKSGKSATAVADDDWQDVSHDTGAAPSSGVAPMKPPTNTIPKNYGFTLGNVLSNAWEGAKGLVKSGAQAAYDVALGEPNDKGELEHGVGGLVGLNAKGEYAPVERAGALVRKYITDPMATSANKAEDAAAQGHISEAAGHAGAALLPIVGPWAESLGEQAGAGDVGGAFGQAAGTVGAGEILPKIAEHAPAVADKIARGTPITEAGKLEAAKQQALTVKKPSISEVEYIGKVNDALPDLQQIAQDNKGKIKTPRDAVRGMNGRIAQMESPIAEQLSTLKAPEDMVHADQYQDAINQAMDAEFAKHPGQLTPEEITKAKGKVMQFVGDQPKTLEEIEGNRKRMNADAEDYFNARPADKRVMDASDATAIAQKGAANQIRSLLYGQDEAPGLLEKAGIKAVDQAGNPVPMRDFRKKVGNLIDIRNHFEDAITKAEQTGDWKPFESAFKGPSIAAGGLGVITGGAAGGPLGAVLGGLAGEGLKSWADYLRSKNPNLNVEKMFRNLENTSAPNTAGIQVRQPVHQYPDAIGPRIPDHLEPIGPKYQISGQQEPLHLPESPEHAPLFSIPQTPRVGEFPAPAGDLMAPIQGQQMPLHMPGGPQEAPLWNLEPINSPKHVPELQRLPGAPSASPVGMEHEQGILPRIGGPGREGILGRIEGYKPSEKAATLAGPVRDLGPEFRAGEASHELQRNRDILRNPSATAEEKRIAQSRIDEAETPPVKVTTDKLGIRWAESPDRKYRVSVPKGIPDDKVEEYARPKLEEQAKIHGNLGR